MKLVFCSKYYWRNYLYTSLCSLKKAYNNFILLSLFPKQK
jgi:hypothetical protein